MFQKASDPKASEIFSRHPRNLGPWRAGLLDSWRAGLLALALGLFLAPGAWATAPSSGLRTTLEPVGAAPHCGETLPLVLRVQNRDALPIDLLAVEIPNPDVAGHPSDLFDERPRAAVKGQDNPWVEPWPWVEWPIYEASRLRATEEVALPVVHALPETEVLLPFRLERPTAEGVYKEIVRLSWTYSAGAPVAEGVQAKAEAVLHYSVEGECITAMTATQYAAATATQNEFVAIDQEPILIDDSVVGVLDNPFEEEPELSEAMTVQTIESEWVPLFNDDEPTATGTVLNLRYCLRIPYIDHFDTCPVDTTGMKWWRPTCDEQPMPLLGLEVMLLDRDGTSHDDVIGRWALHYDSREAYSCIDFQWDQAARGELYPDVYPVTFFDVRDTEFGAGEAGHLCRENQESQQECSLKYKVDWRGYYTPDLDPSTVPTRTLGFGAKEDLMNQRAMGMATVQKAIRAIQGERMTGDLNVWWNGDLDPNDGDPPWPAAYDDNWFVLTEEHYRKWTTGPHEAGHSIHMQLFEQSYLTGEACPSPHFLDGMSNDSCATREGWAEFFAMLTWFTGPEAKSQGNPTYDGFWQLETGPTAGCMFSSQTELHVARTFWDIYDSQVDGLDTSTNGTSRFRMLEVWDRFEDGTGNRQDQEGGANGVNLQDYLHNAAFHPATQQRIDDAMAQNNTDCQNGN